MFLEIIGWTFAGLALAAVIIIGIDAIRKGLKKELCPKCKGERYYYTVFKHSSCGPTGSRNYDTLKKHKCENCNGKGKI